MWSDKKGDRLTQQQHLLDTKIWGMLFEFQKKGDKGVINKILQYGGCILADSVGLGKTFEALNEVFDLENFNNTISLNEFSLEDFRTDLGN